MWGFDVPEPKPWKKGALSEGAIVASNRPCRYAAEISAKIELIERSSGEHHEEDH
jgi:hypothetical protein